MAVLAKKKGDDCLVTSYVLASMFGVTQRSISNFVKDGMPKLDGAVYNIRDCFKWYMDKEVDKRFEKLTVDDLDDYELSEAQVDIALKKARTHNLIEDTQIKSLKKDILDGVYVKADELDRNMAELAGIFVSALKDIRATMPKILANRTEEEVTQILDDEFEQCVMKVNKGIFADEDGDDELDV